MQSESEGYITTDDNVRLFYQKIGNGPKVVIILNRTHLVNDFRPLMGNSQTFIFYDLRNRGRSDQVTDSDKLKGGVHFDVEDLETVRRYFSIDKAAIIGHSYVGIVVALYAMKYPMHVERVIQISAGPPKADKEYPDNLKVTAPPPPIF